MPRLFWILSRSKILWWVYIVMPLMLSGIVYAIFIDALPRKLPVGVVDRDNSSLSLEIVYSMQSSAAFDVKRRYDSIHEAKSDLNAGRIYALAVLPSGMQRGVKLGVEQKVAFYYNAQFILIGKALDNAFLQVMAPINAKLQSARNLIQTQNIKTALGRSVPILPHINALFNSQNSYAQFLLTLILPCMWQILLAIGLLNLLRYPLSGGLDLWSRVGFNLLVFTFWGMAMVFLFDALHYPLVGEVSFLFLGFVVLGLCVSGIVLSVQGVYQNATKSIGMIAAYTAPSLAFAGVTYPQDAMSNFAVFWSHILPISYFMKFYFHQANYGGSVLEGLRILSQMLPFLLFLPLGYLIYRKKGKV